MGGNANALRVVASLCCVQLVALQALYPDSGPIVKLNAKGWEAMQADTQHLWVVEFYADWCGHCKQFAPAYTKAATNLDGLVKFGAVNADDAKAKEILSANGVSGYPTIKLFLPDAKTNPYTGKVAKEALNYDGPRTAKSLVDFVTKSMPDLVVRVASADAHARFLAEGAPHLADAGAEAHRARALLFTTKSETSLMVKALALRLRGRLALGEAKRLSDESPVAKLAAQEGVETFPTLVVLPGTAPEGGEAAAREVYAGEVKYDALWSFLAARAGPELSPAARAPAAKQRALNGVDAVGAAEFAANVESDVSAWVLAFEQGANDGADDAADPARVPGLGRLAAQLRGQAHVGLVNASEAAGAQLAEQLGVETFPALRVLPYGSDRKTKAHAVDVADAAEAKRVAGESLPGDGIVMLTQGNVDQFMASAVANPEAAGAAACLLFSDKSAPPALFKALALHFAGIIDFGMSPNSDQDMLQRFQMKEVPSLLCLWPGAAPDGDGRVEMQGAKYETSAMGPMSFGSMGTFLADLAQTRLGPGWQDRAAKAAGGSGGSGAGAGVHSQAGTRRKGGEDTTVRELTADNAEELCGSAVGLCAIALLDGDRSEAATQAREGHLRTMNGLALRRRGDPAVRLSWLDATCQDHVLAAWDVSDADLPTMVVVSPSKGRFARLMGTFTVEGMSRFVSAVVAGRASTVAVAEGMPALPALDASVDCDTTLRGAAKVAAMEEDAGADADMGDIMAEILEEERQRQAALEAELAAAKADAAGSPAAGKEVPAKSREEMTELERLEAELEDCSAHDLLCQARREKQLKAIEKRRKLDEQIAEAKRKKKKQKKKSGKKAA